MKTQFLVEDVAILKNGKTIVAGSASGGDLSIGMIGKTASGNAVIEVVSVALVNSPPADPSKRALHVRLLAGDVDHLKGTTFDFD
jgi:hypothetical protein